MQDYAHIAIGAFLVFGLPVSIALGLLIDRVWPCEFE